MRFFIIELHYTVFTTHTHTHVTSRPPHPSREDTTEKKGVNDDNDTYHGNSRTSGSHRRRYGWCRRRRRRQLRRRLVHTGCRFHREGDVEETFSFTKRSVHEPPHLDTLCCEYSSKLTRSESH